MDLKRLPNLVIHPFLFALFPIVSLYANNFWEIPYSEVPANVFYPLFLSFSGIIIVLAIFKYFSWNCHRAGIILSFSFILFFSFGHVASSIFPKMYWALFCLWILLYALLVIFALRKIRSSYPSLACQNLTKILNVVGAILILLPFLTLITHVVKKRNQGQLPNSTETDLSVFSARYPAESRRDIYYLIFDRYGNTKNLQEFFNFDNSDFLKELRNLGFYTAEKSTANYLKTATSLSSSLNMCYLDWLTQIMGTDSPDWRPLYNHLLKNSQIIIFLKAQGYQIIHFGSSWQPTAKNSYADFNFNYHYHSFFNQILLKKSFLAPFLIILKQNNISLFDRQSKAYTNWLRIPWIFEKLTKIPTWEKPTFTFVHMLSPHPPHVFDVDGNYLPPKNDSLEERYSKEGYVRQVRYLNQEILKLVKNLQKKSDLQPIIIIQSDEGPFPIEYARSENLFDWTKATKSQLRKKMGILNALYLPDLKESSVLHQDMTPVNIFRIILRNYFNIPINLLPDRNYIFKNNYHLYQFFDVTEKIKTP